MIFFEIIGAHRHKPHCAAKAPLPRDYVDPADISVAKVSLLRDYVALADILRATLAETLHVIVLTDIFARPTL